MSEELSGLAVSVGKTELAVTQNDASNQTNKSNQTKESYLYVLAHERSLTVAELMQFYITDPARLGRAEELVLFRLIGLIWNNLERLRLLALRQPEVEKRLGLAEPLQIIWGNLSRYPGRDKSPQGCYRERLRLLSSLKVGLYRLAEELSSPAERLPELDGVAQERLADLTRLSRDFSTCQPPTSPTPEQSGAKGTN
jgi:hypothetical protein